MDQIFKIYTNQNYSSCKHGDYETMKKNPI